MKNPYLIQRATITTPLADENTVLSRAVDFDYMGSAEFEFGALPKSFRAIEAEADNWKCRLVPEIVEDDSPLRVYSAFSDEDFALYTKHLHELRAGKLRTKEWTNFDRPIRFGNPKTNFWWDISNNVMFGFHKQFMNRLPHYVAASLMKMNSSK